MSKLSGLSPLFVIVALAGHVASALAQPAPPLPPAQPPAPDTPGQPVVDPPYPPDAATTPVEPTSTVEPAPVEPLPVDPVPVDPVPPQPAPIEPAPVAVDAALPPPEATAAAEADVEIAGFDGGFFIRSRDDAFLLKIGARVQFRFTYEGLDGEPDELFFSIHRGRVSLGGHVFTPDLGYKFQAAWDKGGVPTLKDFQIDYKIVKDVLHVRAGQYKKPFSREQVNSSGRLALVDRSITDKRYLAGRDIGVTLHDDFEKSPTFEYAVGVFNGASDKSVYAAPGDATNIPDMVDPLVVARVGYNHGKLKGYSQVDMEGGDPRFGIAANAQTRFNADKDADAFIVIGADYAFKAHGLGISGGLFADWAQTGSQYKDQTFQSVGFFHELSFLFDDVIAPAVRYARIMPEGADNDVQEILGGLGVFPFKHDVKVQADAGPIITDTAGEAEIDYAIRTQLQVGF